MYPGSLRPRLYALLLVLTCGALLTSCASSQAVLRADDAPHLGDAWFAWRAETLGVTQDEARARDAALPGPEGPPPAGALDDHTMREAAALWRDLCAGCHGVDGEPPPSAPGATPPRAWGFGSRMGFTFGGDAMRQSLYRSIDVGKPPAMPAWGDVLAREQIWAIIHHMEGF